MKKIIENLKSKQDLERGIKYLQYIEGKTTYKKPINITIDLLFKELDLLYDKLQQCDMTSENGIIDANVNILNFVNNIGLPETSDRLHFIFSACSEDLKNYKDYKEVPSIINFCSFNNISIWLKKISNFVLGHCSKENDLNIEKYCSKIINIMESLLPAGYNSCIEHIKMQEQEMNCSEATRRLLNFHGHNSINYNFHPELSFLFAIRQDYFGHLITMLSWISKIKIALKLFTKYSLQYQLNLRDTILKPLYNKHAKNTWFKKDEWLNKFKQLEYKEKKYLISIIELEIKPLSNKNNLNHLKNYLLNLIVEAQLDKKEWKYDEIKQAHGEKIIEIFNGLYKKISKLSINKDDASKVEKISLLACYILSILCWEYYYLIVDDPKKSLIKNNALKELNEYLKNQIEEQNEKIVKELNVLPNDASDEIIEEKVINFLTDGFKKIDNFHINESKSIKVKEYKFSNIKTDDEIKSLVKSAFNKIKSNEIIKNSIANIQYIFEKINKENQINSITLNNKSIFIVDSDYTWLISPYIKSLERFIKESILKNLGGSTIEYEGEYRHESLKISNMKLNDLRNKDNKFKKLTFGNLHFIINYQYENNTPAKIKLFDKTNLEYSIFTDDFYGFFVSKIRNGYFHTDVIGDFEQLKKIRIEVAFWFLCVLTELKGI